MVFPKPVWSKVEQKKQTVKFLQPVNQHHVFTLARDLAWAALWTKWVQAKVDKKSNVYTRIAKQDMTGVYEVC